MFYQWKYSGMFLGLLSSTFVSLSTMLVSFLHGFHPYTKSSWRFIATVIPAVVILSIHVLVLRRRRIRLKAESKKTLNISASSLSCVPDEDSTVLVHDSILVNIWPPTSKKRIINIVFLILRSAFGCSAVVLQYYSLKYMSLADSSTVAYSSPVFVSILAHFFLGEHFGLFSFFTTLVTLSGVVCITRPPFLTGESMNFDLIVGACLAFTCTICRGIAIVIVRFLKDVHYSVVLMAFGTWGTVQSLILAWYFDVFDVPQTETDSLLASGMGLLSCAGQICIVLALKAENAGPIALVRTCDVVFAFIFQMIFLRVMPDLYSLLGGAIVLIGVLLAGFRKYVEALESDHPHRKYFFFVLK